MAYKDPVRQRTYQREWARQRKEEHNRKGRIRRAAFIEWMQSLKTDPCTDCGGRFHPAAMHWDHLPGFEKRASVHELGRQYMRKQVVLDEIAKCELVCANCHAVRTYDRIERTPESFEYSG